MSSDPEEFGDMFGEDPPAEQPAPEPEPSGSRSTWVDMLRSTEPPITPGDVGHELDLGAEWWEHYGTAFMKMGGSEGTEAWMNLCMGTALLFLQMNEDEQPSDGEETEQRAAQADASEEITFEGPQ